MFLRNHLLLMNQHQNIVVLIIHITPIEHVPAQSPPPQEPEYRRPCIIHITPVAVADIIVPSPAPSPSPPVVSVPVVLAPVPRRASARRRREVELLGPVLPNPHRTRRNDRQGLDRKNRKFNFFLIFFF